MNAYTRYAVFVVPTGAFYTAGAAWLGWDSVGGEPVAPPSVHGLPVSAGALTRTPRRYGFHGTIKAPFTLAQDQTETTLRDTCRSLCAKHAPVRLPALAVRRLGRFIAIVPEAPSRILSSLAAATVEALDPFRAPLTQAELTRRRKARLTDRQDALMRQWGYPFVMEEFRFHMTLTGRSDHADAVQTALTSHLAPVLPRPFDIPDLAVMGEDSAGRFHLLERIPLTGQRP